jgi:hypothetical protein
MSTPRQFSRAEADRILRRAAEIEGTGDDRPLSLADLKAIGTEAGFGPHTLERAIADIHDLGFAAGRAPVRKSGLFIAHFSTVREIPVGIDADQLMRVVRLCQPYREGPAQVKLEESEISWRDRKGLRLAVTSSGGITEVRVYVSGLLLRRGRWTAWVQAAADRIEALVSLVAAQRHAGRAQLPPAAPPGAAETR